MRFQDAPPDGRAVVYSRLQTDPTVVAAADAVAAAGRGERLLARAVMNGRSLDPSVWRRKFPSLFGPDRSEADRDAAERVLAASLAIADRGDQVRSQLRGAFVEALTARLLERRSGAVRRERRILFDRRPASAHPYDVTVEAADRPEAYDCKWGARGIDAEVLGQLGDARTAAADEAIGLHVALVVFDAYRSCLVRLLRQTAPLEGIRIASLESMGELARRPASSRARP